MFLRNRKLPVLAMPTRLFCLFLFCLPACAANFDIQPIRIDLNNKTRLSKLVIKNVSETDFPIQARAYEWSQNEKGEDVYRETQDIIVFPKIMTIAKGEERFIRLGTNVVPGLKEKTYRVYVEEMPSDTTRKEGATIRLFMKVGIPVFIAPTKSEEKADIEGIFVSGGKIQLKVKNSGNSHFIVTGISLLGLNAKGQESFNRHIGGWYLLSGSEKVYETEMPPDSCNAIDQLDIELKTTKTTVRKQFRVEKSMCQSPVETAVNR